MLNSRSFNKIRNEDGMAALEIVPMITIIILLLNFSIGFFGAIHSGILQSISARNYAFETFSNRSDLTYFRNPGTELISYKSIGQRVHGTITENSSSGAATFKAATRTIAFFEKANAVEEVGTSAAEHEKTSTLKDGRNESLGVNPIWLKTSYGICLTADCKGT